MATNNNGFGGLETKILYNNPGMVTHWSKLKEWQDKGFYKYYGRAWGDNQNGFVNQEVGNLVGFIWFLRRTEEHCKVPIWNHLPALLACGYQQANQHLHRWCSTVRNVRS